MDDLISRQDAIEALYSVNEYNTRSVKAIKTLPSAQPKRETATWFIRKWGDDAQCSKCGQYFKDAYDMDDYDRYCRNCGAKMEKMVKVLWT